MASVMSGKAGRMAAMHTEKRALQNLELNLPVIEQGWEQARGALTKGYGTSRADVKQGYNRFRTDISTGRKQARDVLNQGYGQAIGALQDAYGNAIPLAQQGADVWQQNLARANTGYDMYSNALGLGGEAGRTAALEAFQEGPGYQWNVDQATQQTQRAANRVGGLYGGNARRATTEQASNLANQEWGGWLKNLSGYQGAATQATQGYAGQLNNVAQLYQSQGQDYAGHYAAQGKDLAQNAQWGYGKMGEGAYQYGTDRASLATNYGAGMANAATGRANDIIAANNRYFDTTIPAEQQGMLAGQQAAQNRMGMMMGLGQMAFQGLGGLMGKGGGMFGSMFGGR